jgi:hypothetical protein
MQVSSLLLVVLLPDPVVCLGLLQLARTLAWLDSDFISSCDDMEIPKVPIRDVDPGLRHLIDVVWVVLLLML